MNFLMIVCFVLCLVHLSIQTPKIAGDCSKAQNIEKQKEGCFHIICDGGRVAIIVPCANGPPICGKGKKFDKWTADKEKMYPDCCQKPRCV